MNFASGKAAAELALLNERMEAKLLGTCTIQQLSNASDGLGGTNPTYSTRASGVACHLELLSKGREEIFAGRLEGRQGLQLHLPAEQTILESDRVVYSNETYEVLAVEAPLTGEAIRPVVLVRIR